MLGKAFLSFAMAILLAAIGGWLLFGQSPVESPPSPPRGDATAPAEQSAGQEAIPRSDMAPPPPGAGPAEVPQDRTLRVGLVSLPPALGNPYRSTNIPAILTYTAIFEGLTRIQQDGTLIPWLAESWENPEPNRWVFRLRDDVVFHDGSRLDAAAVAATVNWLVTPEARRETVASELDALGSARALDDLTVEITTDRVDPILPRSLPILYIVEPERWATLGPDRFAEQPVGTGPYELIRWEPGRADLRRHEESWRNPIVERVELYAVPENSARVQGVQAGTLDLALAVGPDDVDAVRRAGGQGTSWMNPAGFGISFILTKDSPLQDVRVRRALNHAVDKQRIVDVLLAGTTVPIGQPAPEAALGHDPEIVPYAYDPDRARALLAEAGYPDGFAFTMEAVMGGGASDSAVYQQVASDLAAIGVTMNIRPFPSQQLVASISSGDWRGEAFGMSFPTEPPLDGMRPIRLHSCLWRSPWYCDETIMPTVDAAFRAAGDERERLIRQVMRHYHEQAPAIYLYQVVRFAAMAADLRGFREVNGFVMYDEMFFEE